MINIDKILKKSLCLLVFILLAGVSYARDNSNKNVYIEGKAVNSKQRAFFLDNFRMEGINEGYNIVSSKRQAAYTFNFRVTAQKEEKHYVIHIKLIRNADRKVITSFDFSFDELNEMYEYDQYLFLRAAAFIPENDSVVEVIYSDHFGHDDRWRHKMFYPRVSIDFPILFYNLQAGGGTPQHDVSTEWVSPLNFINGGLPGSLTFGLEYQFLDFMSIEPVARVGWENPVNEFIFTLSFGAQLKFPLKFIEDFMVEPYAAFSYSPFTASVFEEFPQLAVGGGLQVARQMIIAGYSGAAFLDLSYMNYLGDVVIKDNIGGLFSEPIDLVYQRFLIRIGVGYKLGFKDRK